MNFTKLKQLRITVLAILMVLAVFFGCQKKNDQDLSVIADGKVMIQMNIMEAVFNEESIVGPRAVSKVQVQQIKLNEDVSILAELVPDTISSKSIARALSTAPLVSNTRYKVIVFEGTSTFGNAKIVTERNYMYGREGETPALELDAGRDYWFVAYSVNSKTELPDWSSPGLQTLANANLVLNSGEVDFLHFIKKVSVAGNGTTYLDIAFRHKGSQVTVNLDSRSSGFEMSEIQGASLSGRFDRLSLGLTTGENNVNYNGASTAINFPVKAGNLLKSDPVLYYPKGNASPELHIASMKMGAGTATTNIKIGGFQINPGTRYTLKINFTSNDKFGTYLGHPVARINGKVWKRLNEGVASISTPPDIVGTQIRGKHWTWGYKDPIGDANSLLPYPGFESKLIIKAVADAWDLSPFGIAPTKNTANDPCPSGFRVPTVYEYESLLKATNMNQIGDWEDRGINYATSAVILTSRINSRIKLTFPAAGIRSESGLLTRVNGSGNYQTSTSSDQFRLHVRIFSFYKTFVSATNLSTPKYEGESLRCIAATADPITIN